MDRCRRQRFEPALRMEFRAPAGSKQEDDVWSGSEHKDLHTA